MRPGPQPTGNAEATISLKLAHSDVQILRDLQKSAAANRSEVLRAAIRRAGRAPKAIAAEVLRERSSIAGTKSHAATSS